MPVSAQYYLGVYELCPVKREENRAVAESAFEQQQQRQHCQWLPTLQLVDHRRCLGTIRHATILKDTRAQPPSRLDRASLSETRLQRDGEAICFSGTTLKDCQSLNLRDRLATRHRHHLSSVLAQSNASSTCYKFEMPVFSCFKEILPFMRNVKLLHKQIRISYEQNTLTVM